MIYSMTIENTQQNASDEIDLSDLIKALVKGKWIILATTALFIAASVFYALSLPNVYKSEVTLVPSSESGGLNIPGQLGGLAALAGVNLGGKGGDKTALAIEILKSREFLGRFIEENDLYIPVMATKGWNRAADKLLINNEIYDENQKMWVREVEEPFQPKPSILETITEFKKLISISQDKMSGMVKLTVEYYSPIIAKNWADALVKQINEEMRNRDSAEAEKSINYLNQQIENTNLSEMRSMLFTLIEEQMKTKMLAHARQEYVLKTIDAAVIAELKSGPKRALIVVMAAIFGLVLSMMIVILRFISRKSS